MNIKTHAGCNLPLLNYNTCMKILLYKLRLSRKNKNFNLVNHWIFRIKFITSKLFFFSKRLFDNLLIAFTQCHNITAISAIECYQIDFWLVSDSDGFSSATTAERSAAKRRSRGEAGSAFVVYLKGRNDWRRPILWDSVIWTWLEKCYIGWSRTKRCSARKLFV